MLVLLLSAAAAAPNGGEGAVRPPHDLENERPREPLGPLCFALTRT